MVSSSTKDRGEALWESLYRSTNGCCMWLGNIPDGKKGFIAKNCDLANNFFGACYVLHNISMIFSGLVES